jgi:hypothetical protein
VGDEGLEVCSDCGEKQPTGNLVVTSAVTSEALSGDLKPIIDAWPRFSTDPKNAMLRMFSESIR